VEADKAWETSWTRRGLIAVFTYIVVGIFLTIIHLPNPWVGAIVPIEKAGAFGTRRSQ